MNENLYSREQARDLSAFRAALPALLREHEGQYVLVKADEEFRFYRRWQDALVEGYRSHGVARAFAVCAVQR